MIGSTCGLTVCKLLKIEVFFHMFDAPDVPFNISYYHRCMLNINDCCN